MPVRFKLPENMSAVTVGTFTFTADDEGIIEVPDDVPAVVLNTLTDPNLHNLKPEPEVVEEVTSDTDTPTTDPAAPAKPAKKKA